MRFNRINGDRPSSVNDIRIKRYKTVGDQPRISLREPRFSRGICERGTPLPRSIPEIKNRRKIH